jgi:hypothetical protein
VTEPRRITIRDKNTIVGVVLDVTKRKYSVVVFNLTIKKIGFFEVKKANRPYGYIT